MSRRAVDELDVVVDALAAESIDGRGTHALAGDLVAMRRAFDRFAAQFARRLHAFERIGGPQAESSPNTIAWLRGACGMTAAAAADHVRMARALGAMPKLAASFEAGQSPSANVSLIGRLADTVGCDVTRTIEETLVAAAETADPGRMFDVVSTARQQLDADGAADQEKRNHARRWFCCRRRFDGMYDVRGELDREGGAIVQKALDAMCKPHGPEDVRSGSQRRADGLVDIAAGMLRMGDLPSVHGERPHLLLTATRDALRGVPGAAPAEIEGAGPVSTETARRLTCDAAVRVATGRPGDDADRSFSIGRASRSVPAAMRTAIALRDKGCRFPRCDRPAAWTDAHHAEHWADGGATEVPNLVSLCRFHHRVVHELGSRIRLLADGSVEVVDRDGRVVTERFSQRE